MRPLLLRPCEVPRFLKPIQCIDVSDTALFEKNYPKICGLLGGTVRHDPDPLMQAECAEMMELI